ncbi:MAG: metallophosphoesterase family protein [bacterium]
MKIAIISDIHSNLPALEAVLASIDREGCEQIYCLGDVVGYGAHPNEVIELLISQQIPTVLGNHDAAVLGRVDLNNLNAFARLAIMWTEQVLSADHKRWLSHLPILRTIPEALIVHSSPLEPENWDYIFTLSEAKRAFPHFNEKFCFIGHTHFPQFFSDSVSGKKIVNVGSVGQPRDRDPRACYIIFYPLSREFQWVRVDYDVERAIASIVSSGLPPFLGDRLRRGT